MGQQGENRNITIGMDEFRTIMESMGTGPRLQVPTFVSSTMYVRDWLLDFEARTDQANWDDNRRLQKVRSFFDAKVQAWYDATFSNEATRPQDWKAFKEHMIRCYSPVGHSNYLQMFYSAKQERTEDVMTYCNRLLYYSNQANINFENFVQTCIAGLRPEIRKTFVKVGKIENYDELTERARIAEEDSRIEDNPANYRSGLGYHEVPYRQASVANVHAAIETYGNPDFNSTNSQQRYNNTFQNNNLYNNSASQFVSATVASANATREPTTPSNVQSSEFRELIDMMKGFMQTVTNSVPRDRTNITCFYCRKVGHIASVCRKKQQDQRAQGNRRAIMPAETHPQFSNDQHSFVPIPNQQPPPMNHHTFPPQPYLNTGQPSSSNHQPPPTNHHAFPPQSYHNNLAVPQQNSTNQNAEPPSNNYQQQGENAFSMAALSTELSGINQEGAMMVGPLVEATTYLNGHPIEGVIDTGSQLTFITSEIAERLAIPTQPYVGPSISAVGTDSIQTLGQSDVEIGFRNGDRIRVIEVTVVIVDVLPDGIHLLVGQNVNSRNGMLIDPSGSLIFKPLEGDLYLNKNLEVPARTVSLVTVSASNKRKLQKGTFLTSTDDHLFSKNRVSLANSLVEIKGGTTLVQLCNFGQKAVSLAAGCKVGTYESKSPEEIMEKTDEQQTLGIMGQQQVRKDEDLTTEVEYFEGKVKIGTQLQTKEREKLLQLLCQYRQAFAMNADEIGLTNKFTHRIDTGTSNPISVAPYRVSPEKRKVTNQLVQELIDTAIVQPSSSPWASPIVLVKKKTGDWRFCVDYRKLNSITKKDHYPLPNINDALDYLCGSTIFTSLDLKSGYYQIGVDETDKEKTAFVVMDGLYEFNVMPFGLTNAPATFQRCMDVVLSGLKYNSCLVYLDDILIFSKTFDDHLENLKLVLDRIINAGLKLNPTKSMFALPEVTYLGFKVTQEGQAPEPSKISAVKNFPIPKCVRDVKSFVAFCSYYRKFIKNFACIAKPLTMLTKQDVPFYWEQPQQQAFETLRDALINAPVLAHYQTGLPIEVRTDASGTGVGAAILQQHGKDWRPVAFASRQMNIHELNYPISEKECLAIVFALEKFRVYLEHNKFKVITDHCALAFLQTKKQLPARLTRWALLLQEFDMEIEYKSGKHHADADCLSRYAVGQPEDTSEFEERVHVFNFIAPSRPENFQIEQQKDRFCANIIDKMNNSSVLSNKKKKKIAKYLLKDNLLYKKVWNEQKELNLLVVPKSLRTLICTLHHDSIYAGHPGIAKTYERIRSSYYWPGMSIFINHFVSTCYLCQTKKHPRDKEAGRLQPIRATYPFERVNIDILGPLPKAHGKKYIIAAVCAFTKYLETAAIASTTAQITEKFIKQQIFCRHGSPTYLISDNGTNFTSKLVESLMKDYGVKHLFTTPYHPQSNGQIERINSSIANMLSMYVNEYHTNWDEFLPYITFAYNTSVHSSTKMSPFELIFGRKAITPGENHLPIDIPVYDEEQRIDFIENHWPKIREFVNNNLAEARSKNEGDYNENHSPEEFEVGDTVLVFYPNVTTPGVAKKLCHQYHGPFVITEKKSPLVYVVKEIGTNKIPQVVNIQRLKKFKGRQAFINEEVTRLVPILSNPEMSNLLGTEKSTEREQNEHLDTSSDASWHDTLGSPNLDQIYGPTTSTPADPLRFQAPDSNTTYTVLNPKRLVFNDPSVSQDSTLPDSDLSPSKICECGTPLKLIQGSSSSISSPEEATKQVRFQDRATLFGDSVIEERPTKGLDTDYKPPKTTAKDYQTVPRVTRSSTKAGMANLVLTLMILTQKKSNADFNVANPLTWQMSQKLVAEAEGEINVKVYFPNTCDMIANSLEVSIQQQNEFLNWCNHEYEETTVKVIKKYCSNELDRQKREITMAIIVGVVFAGIAAYGLIRSFYDKFDNISQRLNEQKLAELQLNNKAKEIVDRMNTITTRINNNSLRLDKIENSLIQNILTTSGVANKFVTTKLQLVEIFKSMQQRKVSNQVFSLLNISSEDEKQYPHELMTVNSCNFNSAKRMLSLKIHGFKRNQDFILAEADAFWMRIDQEDCIYYSGPKNILYNQKNKNICQIQNRAMQKGPLIINAKFKCVNPQLDNTELWDKKPCDQNIGSDVQIKTHEKGRFVYCYGHKIQMGKKQFDCPNWVFLFSNSVPLIIDDETHEYFEVHPKYQVDVKPVDFDVINHFLSNGQSHSELLELMDEDGLDKTLAVLIETHPIISIPLFLCTTVILLTTCFICYHFSCVKQIKKLYKRNGISEVLQVKETEESIPLQTMDSSTEVAQKSTDTITLNLSVN